jgi:phosphoglycolate phosphatase-like HAD superfamily hydrolase
MDHQLLPEWLRPRPKPRAIICDIDDTICSLFDVPFSHAVEMLTALDRAVEVHYVTARPPASRQETERFLAEHRLPGWRNLHFCPSWQLSLTHKTLVMERLAREYRVLASIGDHDQDEKASRSAGIPFVHITDATIEQAWAEVARLVAASLTDC